MRGFAVGGHRAGRFRLSVARRKQRPETAQQRAAGRERYSTLESLSNESANLRMELESTKAERDSYKAKAEKYEAILTENDLMPEE